MFAAWTNDMYVLRACPDEVSLRCACLKRLCIKKLYVKEIFSWSHRVFIITEIFYSCYRKESYWDIYR